MAESVELKPCREHISKLADEVVLRVNEYDDRTSPEDWPEALLITSEELHGELMDFAEALLGPASGSGQAEPYAGAAANHDAEPIAARPLFCREDEDPVEFQRLVDEARARNDAALRHEDLCRVGRLFNRHCHLGDDLDRRANETLKALIAEAWTASLPTTPSSQEAGHE